MPKVNVGLKRFSELRRQLVCLQTLESRATEVHHMLLQCHAPPNRHNEFFRRFIRAVVDHLCVTG
jgi:hypothetical protein